MDQERANELVARANELHNSGQRLEAAPLYVEAAEAFPPYASFALVAGDTFADTGHPDDAVKAYRVCLAGEPDHEQAWLGLGQQLLRVGDEAGAREAYGHASVPFPLDQRGCLARWFGGR